MAQSKKNPVVAIVGATASGKTALSIALAKRFGGEIISCDSMQLYRGMDIGTAKPTEDEKQSIPHHMIDILDPNEDFNSTDYSIHASECVLDIINRGKLPILCGGTGLYLDSFLRGVREDDAVCSPEFREEMRIFAEQNGAQALHLKLAEVDPDAANAIHPNNIKRVIRALEIFKLTGKTKTFLDAESQKLESPYNALVIGIRYPDRDILYERINRRVELMLANGLIDEVKALLDKGFLGAKTTAGQAIGYKELVGYIKGNMSLADATEALKFATRHYAKRQITWFEAKSYVNWIDAYDSSPEAFEKIVNNAEKLFISHGLCDII